MAGGHATHSGISFQDKVAAVIAIYGLAEESLPSMDLPGAATLTSVELETNAPVDDILVGTSAGGFCFINVKKGVGISDDTKSPLGSVLDQFVRQWIACKAASGIRKWERSLDPEKDRLVLITGGTGSQSLVSAVSNILRRIADRLSIHPKEDIAATLPEIRAYDAILALLRLYWSRHLGITPTDTEIASFLRMMRVMLFDPDGIDKAPALALLRRSVLENPNDAENAFSFLVEECQRMAKYRSGRDRGGLREALRAAGFMLRHVPELEGDIKRLESFTEETLAHLAHLSHLLISTEQGTQPLEIDREVTRVLVDVAQQTSLLLIGSPGAGKSGALHSAARQLKKQGHPVVVIAVDLHPVESIDELSRDLGITNSFFKVLKGWTTNKPGILLIDALDATRGGPSEKVFQGLIQRVLSEIPGWRAIASIRAFDLRFGIKYRELFEGVPINKDFCDPDFSGVQHLMVPPLSENELGQVWLASPEMGEVYKNATQPLRNLLRSPFNLFLLANILSHGGLTDEFAGVSTQVELLNRYWSHRVIGIDRKEIEREKLLRHAAERMIEKQVFFISRQTVEDYGGEYLRDLMSNEVLSAAKGRGDQVIDIAFSHHMLFDYAIARLILEGGHAPDLADQLTASDDRALLLAPAAMLALRMLWEDDEDRAIFWDKSLRIAANVGAGAFCRMLPARVAADLTVRSTDFSPLVECLGKTDCIHHCAAAFLVKHALGALATGPEFEQRVTGESAAEWCRIFRVLAETAIAEVGWMLKPVIAQSVKDPSRLTNGQKQDIGKAARHMLISGSGAAYDEGMVIVAIEAVSRTFDANPIDSSETLRLLLAPEHVRTYGYRELFWLAKEFDHLIVHEPHGPQLIAELYRAAFCTPLPSKDEPTRLGHSRILSLISNKKQDFELARHQLEERFARFVEDQPVLATGVLIDALEFYVKEERERETEIEKFPFGDIQASYRPDWSFTWISARNDNEQHVLLTAFTHGLGKLVESNREQEIEAVIETLARRNSLACIWASLLKVGTKYPDVIGKRLLPLLAAPQVLAGPDSRKTAGDLISILHPLLSSDERQLVENAILATDRQETQRILLGCLQRENIILGDVRDLRTHFEADGPLPENRNPFSITTRWGGGDDDWWLKKEGVDLSLPENAALNLAIKTAEEIKPPEGENSLRLPYLKDNWDKARDLLRELLGRVDAPEALRNKGWDILAENASKAAETCTKPDDLGLFPEIEAMVIGALDESLWPFPEADSEKEKAFSRGPSWSSPSPRIAGTAALMALSRAINRQDSNYSRLIEKLAVDPHPAVRHWVFSRINMLFYSDPALMWRLCQKAFLGEQNTGVLSFFLGALHRILESRPEWITNQLLALPKRIFAEEGEQEEGRVGGVYVNLILRLWLVYDQAQAGDQVRLWIQDPIKYSKFIGTTLTSLRSAIIQGDPERDDVLDQRVRARTIELLHSVVATTVRIFADLSTRADLNEVEQKTAETSLHLIDLAAREIFSGSGAYGVSRSDGQDRTDSKLTPQIRQRFLREMGPTLEALCEGAYPSVIHSLLETLEVFVPDDPVGVFRLLTRALDAGGRTGGYQYEGMGAQLFVRIIRRYLADFRSVLVQHEDCRRGLMRVLDIFVEAGWPEARQLVYELPEMLR